MSGMCRNRIYIASKKKIIVSIPAGIDNGQSVRIREKGEPGVNGGPRGDLLVEVDVSRHPIFQRLGYEYLLYGIDFLCTGSTWWRDQDQDGRWRCFIRSNREQRQDTKVRLKGKGVPSLEKFTGQRRSFCYSSDPDTGSLSAEAKEALRKFDELTGNTLKQQMKLLQNRERQKGQEKRIHG